LTIFFKRTEGQLTWLAGDAGSVLGEPLLGAGVLERQDGGPHPALPPHRRQSHDVRRAPELQHLALADEPRVVQVEAQLQVAGEQVKAVGVA